MSDSQDTVTNVKVENSDDSVKTEIDPPSQPPLSAETNTSKPRKLPEHDPQHPLKKAKVSPPVHEMVGGSSVRQYLNKNLTQHLLEGLREVCKNKSDDPLRELGQFLISKSDELKKNGELAQ